MTRGAGKTNYIVEWFKQDPKNRAIICLSEGECLRLHEEYDIPYDHLFSTRRVSNYRGRNWQVAIDNVDIVLQDMFGGNLKLATWTVDD